MPCSTQAPIRAICSSLNRRSPANSPKPCAGCHGGMMRDAVTSAILAPCGTTSSYEIRENGPISPERWQVTQCSYRIGAIASLNVTRDASGSWLEEQNGWHPSVPARTTLVTNELRMLASY